MLRKKLRSNHGASITFALLIFLVCVVISSVVIVAATTASGRISNMAKIDRSYYAVTSAATLLRSKLDNSPVTFVKKTQLLDDPVYYNDNTPMNEPTYTPAPTTTPVPTPERYLFESYANQISDDKYIADNLINNGTINNIKRFLANSIADGSTSITGDFEMKVDDDNDFLPVWIKIDVNTSNTPKSVSIKVSSRNQNSSTDPDNTVSPFSLDMLFTIEEIDSNESLITKKERDVIGTSTDTNNHTIVQYKEVNYRTNYEKKTVIFHFVDISK